MPNLSTDRYRRVWLRCALLLLHLPGATSCDRPPDDAAVPQVKLTHVDGIDVANVPPLEDIRVPQWETRREFSTNRGRQGVELYDVTDGLFINDSTLAVANRGAREVLLIGMNGVLLERLGGEGQGPGEFAGGPSRLLPRREGGFLAFDYDLSSFGEEGDFLGRRPLDALSRTATITPLLITDGGSIMAVLWEGQFGFAPERRDTVPLVLVKPDGIGRDTIGTWLGRERAFARLGMSRLLVPIGFAQTAYAESNGNVVAIGSTDSLDVTVVDRNMKLKVRIVAPHQSRRATAEDVEKWRELLLDEMPVQNEEVIRAWKNGPVREVLPNFEGLQVGPEGSVWVGEYTPLGATQRRWIVFSPSGMPVAEVYLPAPPKDVLPGRTELLAVGHSRVAVLLRSRLGEQHVEVWSINGHRGERAMIW